MIGACCIDKIGSLKPIEVNGCDGRDLRVRDKKQGWENYIFEGIRRKFEGKRGPKGSLWKG